MESNGVSTKSPRRLKREGASEQRARDPRGNRKSWQSSRLKKDRLDCVENVPLFFRSLLEELVCDRVVGTLRSFVTKATALGANAMLFHEVIVNTAYFVEFLFRHILCSDNPGASTTT